MSVTRIEKILNEKYGVGVVSASFETILWAFAEIPSSEEANKELAKVNSIRKKHGVIPVYVQYGHRHFLK